MFSASIGLRTKQASALEPSGCKIMTSSSLHAAQCFMPLRTVRQRQQCSQAKALQRLACRQHCVRRRSRVTRAASGMALAEPPSVDLDLQGADFCGSEGKQT